MNENQFTNERLKEMQSWDLDRKIATSLTRISEFVNRYPNYDPEASTEPDEMGWVNWNPKKIWIPSAQGLGFHYVFDCLNEVYGENFIRYK